VNSLGGHPLLMRAVSERSGVHVIAVMRLFPESMGIPHYWRRRTVEELAEFFLNAKVPTATCSTRSCRGSPRWACPRVSACGS
jgi:hypothetical protein